MGAALAIAAIVLVVLTEKAGNANVRDAANLRALDYVALLQSGTEPDQLHIRLEEDAFVQIVGDGGSVVASSPTMEGQAPAADLNAGESQIVEGLPGEEDDPFMVVGRTAAAGSEDLLVLVGRSLEDSRANAHAVAEVLVIVFPLMLLVVGLTTWAMVGRALEPVEEIRKAAAEISGAELHRRVPNPSGDDEIARLTRTMNDMLSRLEESRAEQHRFVSDASHELRNPIAAIRQHAETALAHPELTHVPGLAEDVLAENSRLQEVAENLLLLARIDERAVRTNRQTIDLDDIVLTEAARLTPAGDIHVDTRKVSAAQVRGDKAQLERLVRNLLVNAVRYAESAVDLSLDESAGQVSLRVDDDGPGIPAPERARVFQRFSRLDEGRARDGGGAGLGLAIVAGVVAIHDGSVSVEDSPLGGARFVVLLPLAQS